MSDTYYEEVQYNSLDDTLQKRVEYLAKKRAEYAVEQERLSAARKAFNEAHKNLIEYVKTGKQVEEVARERVEDLALKVFDPSSGNKTVHPNVKIIQRHRARLMDPEKDKRQIVEWLFENMPMALEINTDMTEKTLYEWHKDGVELGLLDELPFGIQYENYDVTISTDLTHLLPTDITEMNKDE
jgi:hypothetical protein